MDLKLSLELLKSSSLLRGSEYTVRVVQVDLPSVPKAIVALLSIPQPDGHADILQQLKLHCQENLASYLVPEFIFHSPLLSGQTEGEGSSSQADKLLALKLFQEQETVLPRNKVEQQLELIWRSQLRSELLSDLLLRLHSINHYNYILHARK